MPQLLETHRDRFAISTDPARLDVDAIADLLARAYWAQGRTREMIARYLQHSLAFGLSMAPVKLVWHVSSAITPPLPGCAMSSSTKTIAARDSASG